jgi:hypothetical protein
VQGHKKVSASTSQHHTTNHKTTLIPHTPTINSNNFDNSFKLMFHKARFNILHMKAESYYGTIVIMTSRHNFNLPCNSSSNIVYNGAHWLAT